MYNPRKIFNWFFYSLQVLGGLLILLKLADGWGLSTMSWWVACSPFIVTLVLIHVAIMTKLYVSYMTLIEVVGVLFDDYEQRIAPLNPQPLYEEANV